MPNLNQIKTILSALILTAALVLSTQIILISNSNQHNKQDYAELGHIKYGLFSVNKWKEQIALIIFDEITNLNLTKDNAKLLKKHVEVQVNGLIDKVQNKIKESNKGTVKGWMKQSFLESFVNIDDIKTGIPAYADAIIAEMTKASTEHDVKGVLKQKIQGYISQTFENQDLSKVNHILIRNGTDNIDSAKTILDQQIKTDQRHMNQKVFLLVLLLIILFSLFIFQKSRPKPVDYSILILSLLTLLVVGIKIPMIDLEAKIAKMSFMLLNHPILFLDQVLYFQSKSILDVFWLMVTNDGVQMKLVGLLIATFSIVFPLIKLTTSVVYYYDFKGLKENKWIQFFVLKSGKWSMADVMIVAIFMAYIGFNGVIGSQLENLVVADQDIVVLTTNGTSLQPGFYVFFSYVILSLFFSQIISKATAQVTKNERI